MQTLPPHAYVVNYTNATSQRGVSSPLGVFCGGIQLVRARRTIIKLLRNTGCGVLIPEETRADARRGFLG